MGFYLGLFWVLFVIFAISGVALFFGNLNKRKKEAIANLYFFILIMMSLSFFTAIATKDPFLEGLPLLNEVWNAGWEVGLTLFIVAGGFFSWWLYLKKDYLKPLREDVTKLQTETSKIDERTKNIQEDTKWIKDNWVPLKRR